MQPVVCLVGPRCVGKTTVGAALAQALGWPFTDLDEELVRVWREDTDAEHWPQAGELLESLGLDAFRALEERALEAILAAGGPRVLATGGGCVERATNRARLLAAKCFWMSADPELLQRRLAADPAPRPGLDGGYAGAELPAQMTRREPLYAEIGGEPIDLADASVGEWVTLLCKRLG